MPRALLLAPRVARPQQQGLLTPPPPPLRQKDSRPAISQSTDQQRFAIYRARNLLILKIFTCDNA
jgi:hypothetical protein